MSSATPRENTSPASATRKPSRGRLKTLWHKLGSPRWFYEIGGRWLYGFGGFAIVLLLVGTI